MNAQPLTFRGEYSAPPGDEYSQSFEATLPYISALSRLVRNRGLPQGCWREHTFGDGILESEVILLCAFAGREHEPRCHRLAQSLMDRQNDDGTWSTRPDGPADYDRTIIAYWALSLVDPESASCERAAMGIRTLSPGHGMSARTRLMLALFGQTPFDDGLASMPTISQSEDWALTVLCAWRPVRKRPVDPVLRTCLENEIHPPATFRWNPFRARNARRAMRQLEKHFVESLPEGPNEPTSILPLMALLSSEKERDRPAVRRAWEALDSRTVVDGERERISPFCSTMRDTALAWDSLVQSGWSCPEIGSPLWDRLVRGRARGDLTIVDAAIVLSALARCESHFDVDRTPLIEHFLNGFLDEQCTEGSWGSPETTGLILETLGLHGWTCADSQVSNAIRYLESEQQADSGWPGELGVNHIHGTWRVLAGLQAVGCDPRTPLVRRASAWIKRNQHMSGGWGESPVGLAEPSAVQTAWALLALMSAGEANGPEVDAGITWLMGAEADTSFTTRGPRGFSHHPLHAIAYPLIALAQFHRHVAGGA